MTMATDNENAETTEDGTPRVRRCATDEVNLRLLLEDPDYARRRAAIENQAWRSSRAPAARTGCTKIPVVVHVVWRTPDENISQAQIDSQIEVLNEDFRKDNADVSTVPSVFEPLTADARLEFELAGTDPDGNPTDGVTRTQTEVDSFGSDDAVKASSSGGADPWPADDYLNIWVCRLGGGLLGYAQFPGGPAATDGVVITHTGFGTTGTAAAPFDLGRTTTHEIGHWLNLRHIWGDDAGGCSGSDFVADTPNQAGSNVGTPTFPSISCGNGPNGDMFMNYMDYVDDAVMVMFSTGQVTRMQAALDGPRASIGSSIDCGPKFKFADEPVTLKFRDDIKSPRDDVVKGKFTDDPVTLKFRDDPATFKFVDDIKSPRDDVKNKFADDPGTLKRLDDGTLKHIDDVKSPALDKPPPGDGGQPPGGGVVQPPGGGVVQPGAGGGAAPFVLSTPHHSQAWQHSYPAAARATLEAYEQQLREYEQLLSAYADAEEADELGEAERRQLDQLYAEYERVAAEYQQLTGGQAQ